MRKTRGNRVTKYAEISVFITPAGLARIGAPAVICDLVN
jgi:hypothetical protein